MNEEETEIIPCSICKEPAVVGKKIHSGYIRWPTICIECEEFPFQPNPEEHKT